MSKKKSKVMPILVLILIFVGAIGSVVFMTYSILSPHMILNNKMPADPVPQVKIEKCHGTEAVRQLLDKAEAKAKKDKDVTFASFIIQEAKCLSSWEVNVVIFSRVSTWMKPEGEDVRKLHMCSSFIVEANCKPDPEKGRFVCTPGNMTILGFKECPLP